MSKSTNITWHHGTVTSEQREVLTGHKAADFLSRPDYGRDFIHADDLTAYQAVLEAV